MTGLGWRGVYLECIELVTLNKIKINQWDIFDNEVNIKICPEGVILSGSALFNKHHPHPTLMTTLEFQLSLREGKWVQGYQVNIYLGIHIR